MNKDDEPLTWVRYFPIPTQLSQCFWVRYIGTAKDQDHIVVIPSGIYVATGQVDLSMRQVKTLDWVPAYKTPQWLQTVIEINLEKVMKSHYWDAKKRKDVSSGY